MNILSRLGQWWSDQWRGTSMIGKLAMLVVPLFLGCCGMTMLSALVLPDEEPGPEASAVSERSATIDITAGEEEGEEPTTEPTRTAPTAEPTQVPATATARPSATPRPSSTAEPRPTDAPVQAATSVAATVAASLPTTAPPTAALPTSAPTAAPTETQVVATTQLPQATPTTGVVTSGNVVLSYIFYDGDVPQVESDEYAVITNNGGSAVNIGNWRLNAGEPDQNFTFPSFDLQPGQSCRVYTNEVHPESCGFTFGRNDAIWRNSGDCGALFDAGGAEVSRYCF